MVREEYICRQGDSAGGKIEDSLIGEDMEEGVVLREEDLSSMKRRRFY